ncbi:mitochondrial ribonuclease P protein 1 homolog isoform X2 [Brevipalpus obovatus]|uniref:mitochondrial ribonuclease P protein 1 homolog isoform X2 n=1 Tax=Brevipalpus obovatus TaxID=246614 RepID=UPI003D9DB9FD
MFIRSLVRGGSILSRPLKCHLSGSSMWERDDVQAYILGEREFVDMSIDDFKSIITSEEDRAKVEKLLYDFECIKYESAMVPSFIGLGQMRSYLAYPNEVDSQTFLLSLLEGEIKRYNKRMAAEGTRIPLDDRGPTINAIHFDESTGELLQGSWRNSYLIRLRPRLVRLTRAARVFEALQFGQKLLIDCDYKFDNNANRAWKAIYGGINENYNYIRPFNVELCGLKPDNPLALEMQKQIRVELSFIKFVKTHEAPFHELHPRDKLVYVTPNAPGKLEKIDPDTVYVLCGAIDSAQKRTTCYAKVKKLGIPMVRLPFDEYIQRGSSRVYINHILEMFAHFNSYGNFGTAVHEVLPSRPKKEAIFLSQNQRIRVAKLESQKRIQSALKEILKP